MLKAILSKSYLLKSTKPFEFSQIKQLVRAKTYYATEIEGPKENYTKVEKSYEEWKWVERLLPPGTVPQPPKDSNVIYPSGWKPPTNALNYNYFIRRSKNHMPTVYLMIDKYGSRRRTIFRHIEGNIWECEKDLSAYLQDKYPEKIITSYINESARYIIFSDDFEDGCKEWYFSKGF